MTSGKERANPLSEESVLSNPTKLKREGYVSDKLPCSPQWSFRDFLIFQQAVFSCKEDILFLPVKAIAILK